MESYLPCLFVLQVHVNCWNTTEEILDWMTDNNFGTGVDAYLKQWGVYQEKARQQVEAAAEAIGVSEPYGMIWTSSFTESEYMNTYLNKSKYIIQIWTKGIDPQITRVLEEGYKVVFSNHDAWYLDCGMGAWVGEGNNWCSPYIGWQKVYSNSPYELALNLTGAEYRDAILGGEAALWTEQTDDANVDAKVSDVSMQMFGRLFLSFSFHGLLKNISPCGQLYRLVILFKDLI